MGTNGHNMSWESRFGKYKILIQTNIWFVSKNYTKNNWIYLYYTNEYPNYLYQRNDRNMIKNKYLYQKIIEYINIQFWIDQMANYFQKLLYGCLTFLPWIIIYLRKWSVGLVCWVVSSVAAEIAKFSWKPPFIAHCFLHTTNPYLQRGNIEQKLYNLSYMAHWVSLRIFLYRVFF